MHLQQNALLDILQKSRHHPNWIKQGLGQSSLGSNAPKKITWSLVGTIMFALGTIFFIFCNFVSNAPQTNTMVNFETIILVALRIHAIMILVFIFNCNFVWNAAKTNVMVNFETIILLAPGILALIYLGFIIWLIWTCLDLSGIVRKARRQHCT